MVAPLVLIADDDNITHTLLRSILERSKFRIAESFDGRDALQKARELLPDLILMDVQMPLLDGFAAVQLLRNDPATARIPIIVLTAAAVEPLDAVRSLDLGADDYMRKPFSLDELLARIHSKLRAHQLEEKLQQRTNELEALVQIGAQLNEALAIDELADRLLGILMAQIPSDCAVFTLINADGQPILTRSQDTNGAQIKQDEVSLTSRSLVGQVLTMGEPALIADLDAHPDLDMLIEGMTCRGGIGAPLIHGGKKLGVIVLGADAGRYTESDLRVLRSIGEQAALAIRNAQLYVELQGYAQGLETMVAVRTAALQSAQAQLIRAERLASIGTLAAGIAHEVNNPLQPILMGLELTLENMDEGRPIEREMLEVAVREVQRIERIVTGLLEFARPERNGMSSIDLNEIVQEVLSLAGKQLQYARVNVATDLGHIPLSAGSADQLKQVVLNLVVNAMEAMPNGGGLILRSFEEDNFVGLTIADTGIGIPPEMLASVFDPFYTTKADGTGLGLAVSYSIIEGHGGQFEVSSVLNEGTTFTLRLPKLVDSGDETDQ